MTVLPLLLFHILMLPPIQIPPIGTPAPAVVVVDEAPPEDRTQSRFVEYEELSGQE